MEKFTVNGKPISDGMELNPIGWEMLFVVFRLVSRLLKELGVLDEMEAKAKETTTEIDDKAIKIGKSVLDEMSK